MTKRVIIQIQLHLHQSQLKVQSMFQHHQSTRLHPIQIENVVQGGVHLQELYVLLCNPIQLLHQQFQMLWYHSTTSNIPTLDPTDTNKYCDSQQRSNCVSNIIPITYNKSGLNNNHNCCYINSILQGFYSVAITRETYIKYGVTYPHDTLSYNLSQLFIPMNSSRNYITRNNSNNSQCITGITDFLNKYSANNNNAYDWVGTQSDACDFLTQTILPILKEEAVQYASNYSFDCNFHAMFRNAVDPIFYSVNLNPPTQFQSFYWTNSEYHRGPREPIYSEVIDLNIQKDSLRECILDYIKPVSNHID
eukprot:103300_1